MTMQYLKYEVDDADVARQVALICVHDALYTRLLYCRHSAISDHARVVS